MKSLSKIGLVCALSLVAGVAAAATPATGISQLTNAVSFTDVVTGIMAIGVALMGLYVTIRGVKIVLSMVRGG